MSIYQTHYLWPRAYNYLWLMYLSALMVNFSCTMETKEPLPPKPNILLIMSDDLGWYDTGFNGNREIKTPNMDLLASQGVVFDRFYSASAVCSPTRASSITGRNPLRMNIPYANRGHLRIEEITLPEILKEIGYTTGHYGKWHLGTLTQNVTDANRGGREEFDQEYSIPTQHGYDEYFCTESKVPTYDPMVFPKNFMDGESKRFGWRSVSIKDSTENYATAYWVGRNQRESNNLQGDDSRVIMDRVIPFIENAVNSNKPFFSTVWFHTPHLPVVSDSLHRSFYRGMDLQEQIYFGTITAMDEQIGRLWDKINEVGAAENTLIFFCSDNGPEVQTPGSAGVFRERKRSLYEGGVRVPAFAIWKNNFDMGKRIDFPAVTSDYLPTILDILKFEYPDERPIDGVSLVPALEGRESSRDEPIGFICDPKISWVTDRYKLIADSDDENYELYDLLKDKSETHNILASNPEIAEKIKGDLSEWLHSVEASKRGIDYEDASR